MSVSTVSGNLWKAGPRCPNILKIPVLWMPCFWQLFFVSNCGFLLRVDGHDFRLGTWAGKGRTICGVGQWKKLSLIFSKLNVNLNPSPKTTKTWAKHKQKSWTTVLTPNTKFPLDIVLPPSWYLFLGISFTSILATSLSHSISITIYNNS